MRKLLLSICVIAASLAYVTWVAMTREGGLQALFERVTFQPTRRPPPHLDLDDPLLRVEAVPARASPVAAGAIPAVPASMHPIDAPFRQAG